MKIVKLLVLSLLLFFIFPLFSYAADKTDIAGLFNLAGVCDSKSKDSFQSFCEKIQSSAPLDFFEGNKKDNNSDKSNLVDSFKSQSVLQSDYVDENGDGIDDNHEIFIEGEQEWSGSKNFDGFFIGVMPGAKLTIKAGTIVTLKNSYIGVAGKLLVEGTAKNPVVFKSTGAEDDQGFFIFSGLDAAQTQGDEIVMRHADISGGAKSGFFGTITVGNAKLDIKESSIHNNDVGMYVAGNDPLSKQVNRTKFFENGADVMNECYAPEDFEDMSDQENGIHPENWTLPDFQYNWWGSVNGPEERGCGVGERWEDIKCYKNFWGLIDFSHWFSSPDLYDPVIIIPGIMGSFETVVGWKIDPILHTFENLIASFEENGYEKGRSLFGFPYEWRNSNVITAGDLKNKIEEVKNITGLPRVNLVAHSMGGLVARYYIESDDYQNDVDNLITLGTPHKGAPEAYPRWEAAEGFEDVKGKATKFVFWLEGVHNGYFNLKDYIQNNVLSVQELLPDYDYLKEASNGEMRNYPDGYPQNTFLDYLNNPERVDNLENINLANITGKLESEDTTISFRVMESTEEGRWEHGMPKNFYDSSTDRGMEFGEGDGTVPLSSAEGIMADEKIELNSSHGDLPTKAQCEVIKGLSGKEDCEYINTFKRITKILTLGVLSPVDIQIVAPDGKRVGKDFVTGEIINEIDSAYYTGAGDPNEFLTIPNPLDGEYKVLTQGTGSGEYKIEIAKISEDKNSNEAQEINAEIIGTALPGREEEKKLELTETEIVVEKSDQISPVIEIISPKDNEIYLNNETIILDYSVSDNQSLQENIRIQVYLDDHEFDGKNINLAFQKLGEHNLKIAASDEAGNVAEKEIKFNSETNLAAIKDNINNYLKKKLIKSRVVLIAKIKLVEGIQKLIEETKNNRFLKEKTKEKLVGNFQNQVNKHLDWMQDYIQRMLKDNPSWFRRKSDPKADNKIDPVLAECLVESLEFVKYN